MSEGAGLEPGRPATWRWLGPLLGVLFVVAPVLFWRGEYVDVEALGFLEHYWGEGSVLGKVLDPEAVDYYRGRELSYAVDFVDAQWMRFLLERDVYLFAAPSTLLASLALVALGAGLAPRAFPSLRPATRWLGLLVLLSGFTFVSTMGIYYRSTKPGICVLLTALLLVVFAEWRAPRLRGGVAFLVALALALPMCLLDHQGVFHALLVGLGLLLLAGRPGARGLAAGTWSAVFLWYAWDHALGPWLVHAANGYWPSLDYQRLRLGALFRPELWSESVSILADWVSAALGGLPPGLLAALAAGAAGAWVFRKRREPRLAALGVLVGLALFAAELAMVVLMLERHEPLTWAGNRLWYYPLATQVVLVLVLLWCADRAAGAREGGLPAWVPVACAALVASNAARWPELRERMHSVPAFSDQWRQSRLLVESLDAGAAVPALEAEYRRFYFDCLDRFPRLAARAAPQVAEGAGLEVVEEREGRRVAWAPREAQIVPRVPTAGRYVLAGGAILRPGDRLRLYLGATHARPIGEVAGDPSAEGPVFFRFATDLGPGPNDVRLVSEKRARRVIVDEASHRAGYGLLLPVAVWPAPEVPRAAGGFPPELVDWVPWGTEPLFAGTGADTWDREIRERGFILREGEEWKLWYTGYDTGRSDAMALGYATSPDGVHWKRHPGNPVFDRVWTEDVHVTREPGGYFMLAEGRGDIAHRLTSPDGIRWEERGSLDIRKTTGDPIDPGPYGTPALWVEGGTSYLFYERDDKGVWLAASTDRETWRNVQDAPVIPLGPAEYDRHAVALNQVVRVHGRYYAVYHANADPGWKGPWTTNLAASDDLVHWEKYPGNPIIRSDHSSGLLVDDGSRLRLYTMHPAVRLWLPRGESLP